MSDEATKARLLRVELRLSGLEGRIVGLEEHLERRFGVPAQATATALPAMRPCPFCGSENVKWHPAPSSTTPGRSVGLLECFSCLARMPSRRSQLDAINTWNGRWTDDLKESKP